MHCKIPFLNHLTKLSQLVQRSSQYLKLSVILSCFYLFYYNASAINIQNCSELQNMRNNLSGQYTLTSDIDCSEVNFSPVGTIGNSFLGSFDGNNHIIKNLSIIAPTSDYVGLFGNVSGRGSIKNVRLENVNIVGRQFVGALIGNTSEYITISGVYAEGRVTGMNDGSANNAASYIGGLIGYLYSSDLNNSSTRVEVTATGGSKTNMYIGGLVGVAEWGTTISNCYAAGKVHAQPTSQSVGGLVGINSYSTIQNSYSSAEVDASGSYIGGLVGRSNSTVTNSYWDIETSGQTVSAGGTGKTTLQMQHKATYQGWDFTNIWEIKEEQSYPWLRSIS